MRRWSVRTAVTGLLAGMVLLAVGSCADMDLLHVLKARVTGEVLAVHVAPDGTMGGANRGLDPSRAVGSLSRSLDIARDTGATEIRVAEGQYEVTSDDYDDPNGPLEFESEVTIRGGYSADFEERDVARYESRIVVRGWIDNVVGCYFSAEYAQPPQPVGLDGLLFDVVLRDAVPETAEWSAALIELEGASTATVENCTIQVTTGGEFTRGMTVLDVGGRSDWDDPTAAARTIVRGNTILAVSENGEDMTGLSVGLLEPGGVHEVWGNRIMVQGADATGLYLDGAQGVTVANNVISVRGGRDSLSGGMAVGIDCQRELMSGAIVNNTIVFDSPYDERGIWLHNANDGSTCNMDVINNIIAGYDFDASEAIGNDNGTTHDPFYDYNVCFGVDTEGAGTHGTYGSNNAYSTSDLFPQVFGDDWDWNLSNGDQVDYGLHGSSAGAYAIDEGSINPWAGVDTDIRGVSRPQRTACDRGAYEME